MTICYTFCFDISGLDRISPGNRQVRTVRTLFCSALYGCNRTARRETATTKEYHVSDIATPTASYLTQEAFDRLKAELVQLSGEGRTEIAKKIEAARDEGDLRENGGYHAAKEEQGKIEARIRQLTHLLENAKVGPPPADDGIVEPGMVVTVDLLGDDLTFLLGSREIADSDLEVYSEKSPLGAAINGKQVGDKASYEAPNGKSIDVTIKRAKPYTG